MAFSEDWLGDKEDSHPGVEQGDGLDAFIISVIPGQTQSELSTKNPVLVLGGKQVRESRKSRKKAKVAEDEKERQPIGEKLHMGRQSCSTCTFRQAVRISRSESTRNGAQLVCEPLPEASPLPSACYDCSEPFK
ncbi:uncharacterized protein MONOS_10183 [Monocercomonoides exilis]|uniref:uncharacterized protein n=1 Tax=Monocercomonoides exilis TaxID=2049356 RepID=UPI00355989A5|nr:hypothetical protein MONOS_10183 [Monocercomonoides exilis]|eukprot:MONOS_10183.1-p1 / transcript=MONOS_10183.1 / gene=MONOS_10183 / organism=Monocercomonoides_exilis_PA203 / gene_product=unspecified product / transcript_product=unspecified product / location=Mono_scaffold00452:18626-19027(+) / protein_length=134 / sequence_SO=supercontig / SO=protein_coding / is_pseudo=false